MTETISFRTQTEKEELDWKAEHLGMSRSAFINLSVEVMSQFDDEMLKKVLNYADKLRMSAPEMITQIVIRRLAEIEVKGSNTDLSEFISPAAFGEDQKVLENMLKQQFKKEAKNE